MQKLGVSSVGGASLPSSPSPRAQGTGQKRRQRGCNSWGMARRAAKNNLLLKRKTNRKTYLGALLWRNVKSFIGSCLPFNCKHSAVRFLQIMGSFMQRQHLLRCSCNSLHLGGRKVLVFLFPLIWSFPCDYFFFDSGFFHVFFSFLFLSFPYFLLSVHKPVGEGCQSISAPTTFEIVLNSDLTQFSPSV